jgi:NADPH:quinone reductase-like Zn-dependent oxidoreductase
VRPGVRELGADHVVDYTKGDPFASGHGTCDVVLDAVRGTSLARLRKLPRPGGVLVTIDGYPLRAYKIMHHPWDCHHARRIVNRPWLSTHFRLARSVRSLAENV